jgi:hypothetical protein
VFPDGFSQAARSFIIQVGNQDYFSPSSSGCVFARSNSAWKSKSLPVILIL